MTKVLIVDDEQVLTDAYQLSLTKAGYEVFVANRPEAGLTLVKEHKPDVLLIDMLMPGMNGIEFLQAMVRQKLHIKHVIAFSNIENKELAAAAKKLGAVDYLLKVNYTPHQLADVIAGVLKA